MLKIENYYINENLINYFYTYIQNNYGQVNYFIKIYFNGDNFIRCDYCNKEDFEKDLEKLKNECK